MSLTASIMKLFNHAVLAVRGTTVQEALGGAVPQNGTAPKPVSRLMPSDVEYDPDAEFDDLAKPVMNPVIAFHEALRSDNPSKLPPGNPFKGVKVSVSEAWLFEGMFDQRGKLADNKVLESKGVKWPATYRVRHVSGDKSYRQALEGAKAEWDKDQPERIDAAKRRRGIKETVDRELKTKGLLEAGFDDGGWGGSNFDGPFDPNQYTEYAPTYGGPFFKQLYLTDYLRMHSLAFEAWNHNPIAKRIVDLFAQYTFGRRFKVRIKDKRKEEAWEAFEKKYAIRENVSKFWVREYVIYGEIMLNVETWQLVDPSTVWDIITDPDNLKNVYYYYQSYPTAYQMFTGFRVPGQPGSEKVPGQEYVVRQIPAHKILHLKGNCVSNEKRGRSLLFPVLGWLKRIKDLYNAIVVRQWLLSCFIWDDTVKGSAADIAAHAAQYNRMPTVGSTFVHNESVIRTPMAAIQGAGGKGSSSGIGEEIIAFIATALGIPKEFMNLIASSGGGSRASALTSAEPFTKVVEDIQATFESLLIAVAKYAFDQAGLEYAEGDVEFLFPSVTKDTTTETIKNIATGESLGYVSKQTAAEMYAGEMNITNYDFEQEQGKMGDEAEKGLNQMGTVAIPPAGRFGSGAMGGGSGGSNSASGSDDGGSEIHGKGKVALSKNLKTL